MCTGRHNAVEPLTRINDCAARTCAPVDDLAAAGNPGPRPIDVITAPAASDGEPAGNAWG